MLIASSRLLLIPVTTTSSSPSSSEVYEPDVSSEPTDNERCSTCFSITVSVDSTGSVSTGMIGISAITVKGNINKDSLINFIIFPNN